MKRCAILMVLLLPWAARASDAPHNTSTSTECVSCHQGHNAAGMSLTKVDGNANLCLSCHSVSQDHIPAFANADQADPGARRGFHHRWDSGVSGFVKTSSGNVSTGSLRSGGDYSGAGRKEWLVTVTSSGSGTTASFSWTASGGSGGTGNGTCGTAVALNEGVTLTCLEHSLGTVAGPPCSNFFCAGDTWTVVASDLAGVPTNPALTVRLPDGKATCSTCHDQHMQTNASFTTRTVGVSVWKHFMRIPNDAGQLCLECHADRFPADPGNPLSLTRVHTGGVRSHPVGVGLNFNGQGYDRAAPMDADGSMTGDGISSNDLILTTGGKVTCLTCHGMHLGAADGNSRTE